MQAEILTAVESKPFSHWQRLESFESQLGSCLDACGARQYFVGSMRNCNEGDQVKSMRLEHYPGMTEKYLHTLAQTGCDTWKLQACAIVHRVGEVVPGDTIVLVGTWSEHRNAAISACTELVEKLKHEAPFWKQERLENDEYRWVENNTPT